MPGMNGDLAARAREIAMFLKIPEQEAIDRLSRGFGALHGDVAADFRRFGPVGDDFLLSWYITTEAYIWELTAYHLDSGFNYGGMCHGIAERLKTAGTRRVLCLGDGIGDLTLSLCRAGMIPVYHDLARSQTADFALFRFSLQSLAMQENIKLALSQGWQPNLPADNDAIVSLDFLEHVTDVPAWVTAIQGALKPGALFCAQNAFAMGSGPNGSLPMHLARNDRFEKDWDPMLSEMGFVQEGSNWYRKP